jgi:DNA end-binding protein Ku
MYNARTERTSIRFHMINPDTGNRIKMVTKDSETGAELQRSALVKGYEFSKGRYVLLSDEDLDSEGGKLGCHGRREVLRSRLH